MPPALPPLRITSVPGELPMLPPAALIRYESTAARFGRPRIQICETAAPGAVGIGLVALELMEDPSQ